MADTFNQKQLTIAPGNAVVMSPKALKDNPSYDYKLDIFSYGCLILYVFTRQWPIFAHQHKQNDLKLFDFVPELDRRATDTKAIPSGNPSFPFSKYCLENDPKKWPTISDAIICAQCTVSTLPSLKNIMINDNSSPTEKWISWGKSQNWNKKKNKLKRLDEDKAQLFVNDFTKPGQFNGVGDVNLAAKKEKIVLQLEE